MCSSLDDRNLDGFYTLDWPEFSPFLPLIIRAVKLPIFIGYSYEMAKQN